MHFLDWVMMILYFAGVMWAGVYFAKRSKTTEAYFLGNRAFPGWAIGLSLVGTSISSQSFLGIPGDSYKTAWLRHMFSLGLPLGVLAGAYIFLPFYRRSRVTSAFEYLEGRFGPSTRLYGAITFIIAQVIRLAIVLYLLALMFKEAMGWHPMWCVLICGIIVSFYTVAGGIEAVVWTDVVQTVVLGVGAILCLGAIVYQLPGGFAEIWSVGLAHQKLGLADLMPDGTMHSMGWKVSLSEKTALMILFVGITHYMAEYSSNQNVVQRYAASASVYEARKAILICCIASLAFWTFFRFLGTALYVYFQRFPTDATMAMLDGGRKAEEILPHFVVYYMPAGITGIIMAAIFAAAMSSLDSSINAVSTIGIVDIYRRHLRKDRDDAHYLVVARWIAIAASVVMIGGAALFVNAETKTISDASLAIGSIIAAGLLGLYLLGFMTIRADSRAVWVAIACTVAWSAFMTYVEYGAKLPAALRPPEGFKFGVDVYYTGPIGHIIMLVVGYLAGWIWQNKRDLTNLTVWTQDATPIE